MKILIDILHPAHVHYFRNFHHEMREKGHEIRITAREKECTTDLLKKFNLPFQCISRQRFSLFGMAMELLGRTLKMVKIIRSFEPDILKGIAEQFFSKQEAVKFLSLPKKIQKEAFSTCWTRKEAYLKATGKGITLGMDQFTVSLVPGEPAALLSINNNPKETSSFYLEDLNMGPGYKAALAVEGSGCKLKYWQC